MQLENARSMIEQKISESSHDEQFRLLLVNISIFAANNDIYEKVYPVVDALYLKNLPER